MSELPPNREEIAELVERLCSGELTPEQAARLEAVLCTDKSARQYYVRYLHMHASLPLFSGGESGKQEVARLQELLEKETPEDAADAQAGQPGAVFPAVGPASQALPNETRADSLGGGAATRWGSILGGPVQLGGLVLVLIAAAFVSGYAIAVQSHPADVIEVVAAPAGGGQSDDGSFDHEPRVPVIAGRLVRGADAMWDESSITPSVGAPLEAGSIVRLRQGTAEIAFDSGARVFLKGPALFELSSPMAGILHYGSLSTEVPREARGFVVETPRASIVDFGTSFSLTVAPDGTTEEAFVHEGEIRVGVVDREEWGKLTVKKLLKGQGVRIDLDASGESIVHDISAPSEQLDLTELDAFQPRLPNEIAGLRLWLEADAGTFQDVDATIPAEPGDLVARWIDQSGNGLSPRQHHVPHRPLLVTDARGRRALRFDGVRQRMSEPTRIGPLGRVLDTSDRGDTQFTICAVFATARKPEADRKKLRAQSIFGQFAGGTGHASRRLALELRGEVLYSEYPPVGGDLRTAEPVTPNQTYVAVLTRNGEHRSIHLDGRLLVSDDQAERYAGKDPDRWYIGARDAFHEFFEGDISELIIFTRAPPDETREGIEGYLKEKYLGETREEK